MAHWMYKKAVEDIIEQLQAVQARALAVAEAADIAEVRLRLQALEHSMDILRLCVSTLRYRVTRHVPKPTLKRKKSDQV